MDRNALTLTLAALVALLVAAGTAAAQDEINVGEAAAPIFDTGFEGFQRADTVAPEAAPITDNGRNVLEIARDYAYTFVFGIDRGDIGNDAGSPDEARVAWNEVRVIDGVTVPGYSIYVPERTVVVASPNVTVDRWTPAVTVPGFTVFVPGVHREVVVPGIGTPGYTVGIPERTYNTPAVGTPGVSVATPPVSAPANDVTVDYASAGAGFGGASGTVYLGPVVLPYDVPAFYIALDDVLPAAVPRSATVPAGLINVPGRDVATVPATELVESQTVTTPGASHHIDPVTVTDPMHVTTVHVPSRTVTQDPVPVLAAQHVQAGVPGQHVIDVTVGGFGAGTDPVPVTDASVGVPGGEVAETQPVPADDFGYFGYGRDDDSSMYPYACTPVGCARTKTYAAGYVNYADAWFDFTTGTVDGGVDVHVGPVYYPQPWLA